MKIIPIFIPHAGCPHRCIYCNQHKISGVLNLPSAEEVKSIIERNLKTISKGENLEVAFFGGTFTLLPNNLQKKYLDTVYPYIKNKKIQGLRMSTHPEAVTEKSMKMFKEKGGCLVELGVQSLDKEVLKKSNRVVEFDTIRKAARTIKKLGLDLGVQVMLGLPDDTLEKAIRTAEKLIELKPKTARIYPAIVLKGTALGELFKKGRYEPLSMQDAIEWSARVCDIFEKGGVKVIRIGLHPSQDLNSKGTILTGPYHPNFGEMARARQMRHRIINILGPKKILNRRAIKIYAHKSIFSFISGHKGEEKSFLENYYAVPVYLTDEPVGSPVSLAGVRIEDLRKVIAVIDPRMPHQTKIRLKKMGYCVIEVSLHPKLAKPVRGHPDMMLFFYGKKVIYEPHLEKIAEILKDNGYECIKGESIKSKEYPNDIIYDVAAIGESIIRYNGKIEKNIEILKAKFIRVKQGYAKCSVVVVDDKHIITSDKGIKDIWGKKALLVRPGSINLPGYKTGFIGGASGSHEDKVFFTGSLKNHPDGALMREFIEKRGKKVVELSSSPLYDTGSILFFDVPFHPRGDTPGVEC
ncbi:MAG: radical SAM protein [Candidatus Omnitrophica bacterium]|nr:radical SAM protein [Candidatus Omnitrophota bacterium]